MRIVLLGPPGAGKGTQAVRLARHFQIPALSTGDMMRTEAASGSATGRSIQRALETGQLIADDLVLAAVSAAMDGEPVKAGFILDGFPRTEAQAIALDRWLTEASIALDAVLSFELDDDELLRRILGRAHEARSAGKVERVDDNAKALGRRIADYRVHADALRRHYEATGRLRLVDAAGDPDGMTRSILAILQPSDESSFR